MREYQDLIGKIILAAAIIIASIVIAGAVNTAGSNINSGLNDLATLIRDGLLQIGSAS